MTMEGIATSAIGVTTRAGESALTAALAVAATATLRTKILDFRGFGSSRIFIQRSAILMSMGNFPEVLSQQILAGRILVGRLGVQLPPRPCPEQVGAVAA